LAVLLTGLTVLSLPAQQLYCGNSPLTTCSGSIGIGAANNGILGAPIGLTIEHTASSGGGLYVNATTPNGFGILTGSQSGTGLMSTTSSGVAISALASSSSGKALYGETTTGYAIYGRATLLGGRAGVFDGKVDFLDDAEVQGSLQVDQNLDAQNLTIEAPAAHAFGVAHFKAGPDRQLFVAPNLGNGSFNHLSQAGDLGLFFSDGLASGNQNQGAGLVLAPWTGGWARGIRIDADGKVGIGTAAPQAELDVDGDMHTEGNVHMEGDVQIGQKLAIGMPPSGNTATIFLTRLRPDAFVRAEESIQTAIYRVSNQPKNMKKKAALP
jgi:hypothetical protein